MHKPLKILLIDDEHVHNLILSRYMEKLTDVEYFSYDNGEDAVNYLRTCADNEIPDIIILDIRMPLMDGFEFLDIIRDFNRIISACKIYILSSSIYHDDIEKSKSYSFVKEFIQKPISPAMLLEIITAEQENREPSF